MEIIQRKSKLQRLLAPHSSGIKEEKTALPQLPVRLSIITQFYPPDYAPTGQLIEELSTQLRYQGLHIHVFTGQPGYAFTKESAPTIERRDKLLIRRSRTARLSAKESEVKPSMVYSSV